MEPIPQSRNLGNQIVVIVDGTFLQDSPLRLVCS